MEVVTPPMSCPNARGHRHISILVQHDVYIFWVSTVDMQIATGPINQGQATPGGWLCMSLAHLLLTRTPGPLPWGLLGHSAGVLSPGCGNTE